MAAAHNIIEAAEVLIPHASDINAQYPYTTNYLWVYAFTLKIWECSLLYLTLIVERNIGASFGRRSSGNRDCQAFTWKRSRS